MASTINASTSPAAIVQTADGTANLSLQSNGTTIAALTSTGMAVTGTLSASGAITATGGVVVGAAAAPAFAAYWGGADQSISSSTWTKVTLSSEIFDTANAFDSTTNYRFTPQVAGYYQINTSIRIIGNVANNKVLGIYKNGSVLYSMDTYSPSSVTYINSYNPVSMSVLIYLNGSSDYIELYGYSNGTGTGFNGGLGGVNTAPWATQMSGFLARSA